MNDMHENLAIITAVLALAGCAVAPEENIAVEAEVGSAAAALSGTVILYPMAGYVGTPTIVTADTLNLGAGDYWFNNRTVSLKNDTSSTITLWSDINHSGRCQLVLPGMQLPDLAVQDIGPYRLSSIEFAADCPFETSTATVFNGSMFTHRMRVNPNNHTGTWSDNFGLGASKTQNFSKNAWMVEVEMQEYVGGWRTRCSQYWRDDADPIGDVWFSDDGFGGCSSS